jgi:uracil-DNA glycosylase
MFLELTRHLHPSWQPWLKQELQQPYMQDLEAFLDRDEREQTILPPKHQWFAAFEHVALDDIKVVIIGQDPYFNPKQAMGLAFSVARQQRIPPSLNNIYQEIQNDLGHAKPTHGDLTEWAQQGVFLLNASLTVQEGSPGSHLKHGWQQFTSACIDLLNKEKKQIVFLVWGAFAKKVCHNVDEMQHKVIKTSHPSPLGAHKSNSTTPAFFGSRCFSQANQWLIKHDIKPIQWQINC